ncbi:MAG TPA: lysylphosphatidylglycerol synthase transmembrane domain-containing protein [Bacillota bacterium]|nr:lysylphosphatidylglycerol synthase transmembrane domain-containing protein [Bacillota bacterium]
MKKLPPQMQKWFRGGFSLVLILTLCSSALILINSIPKNVDSLWKNLNYPVLVLAFVALVFSWLIEAVRIWLIASGLGEKISLLKILNINLATSFIGNITPFYSGAVPTQIYLLTQNGIQAGRSSAIVTIRLIVSTLIFTLFAPFLLFSYHKTFSAGIMQIVISVAIPISALISLLLIVFIIKPKVAKYLVNYLLKLLHRTRLSSKITPFVTKFLNELEIFHDSIKEFRKAFNFYLVILTTFGYWVCFFAVAPLLMQAFGLNTPGMFVKSILLQFILFFIMAYMPVPGGSGIMELGLFSVLSFVPIQIRAILILVWRFLSYHLSTLVGGIILLRIINRRPSVEFPN